MAGVRGPSSAVPAPPPSSVSRPPAPTIFIGNIPYDLTEQMLVEVFQEVGPVKSMRLVNDRETGKAKGYGFCEYYDVATAEGAVRNLNGHEVHGRLLRVDFADEHIAKGRDRDAGNRAPPAQQPGTKPVGMHAAKVAAQQMALMLGGPGAGGSLPASQEKIDNILGDMSRLELFEIMSAVQGLMQSNYTQASQILQQNPQLLKALFQAQIILGMVDAPLLPATPPATRESEAISQALPHMMGNQQFQNGAPASQTLQLPMQIERGSAIPGGQEGVAPAGSLVIAGGAFQEPMVNQGALQPTIPAPSIPGPGPLPQNPGMPNMPPMLIQTDPTQGPPPVVTISGGPNEIQPQTDTIMTVVSGPLGAPEGMGPMQQQPIGIVQNLPGMPQFFAPISGPISLSPVPQPRAPNLAPQIPMDMSHTGQTIVHNVQLPVAPPFQGIAPGQDTVIVAAPPGSQPLGVPVGVLPPPGAVTGVAPIGNLQPGDQQMGGIVVLPGGQMSALPGVQGGVGVQGVSGAITVMGGGMPQQQGTNPPPQGPGLDGVAGNVGPGGLPSMPVLGPTGDVNGPLPGGTAAPPGPGQSTALDQQKRALLNQVMNLTPEQIELLPPDHRGQVLALQQQMRAQVNQ